MRKDVTTVVANDHDTITADFTHKPDFSLPMEDMKRALNTRAGAQNTHLVDAHHYSGTLIGDTIASNMFLLGFAFQLGQIPVSAAALEQAIQLNRVSVESNIRAFRWGRLAAHDREAIDDIVKPRVVELPDQRLSHDLDEIIERRVKYLTAYQDTAYAERYRQRVEEIRGIETKQVASSSDLTRAVASNYFKLLAYKDEYEVARLYTDGSFKRQLEAQFEGDYRLEFNMAPPILSKTDPNTGLPRKRKFGPWMMSALKVLARLKGLRGSMLDPFRHSADRVLERQLLRDYEDLLVEFGERLTPDTLPTAIELASLPEAIRGYGHVKAESVESAQARRSELLAALREPETTAGQRAA